MKEITVKMVVRVLRDIIYIYIYILRIVIVYVNIMN